MKRDLPNIILVVLDAARWDRFGCYGSSRGLTPTVDSLAADGGLAEVMVSNGPWTLPSHASLFTGLYPSQHGSQWQTGPRLDRGVQLTLAEWLKSIGYRTVCATANGLVSPETGLGRGFGEYVSAPSLRKRRARSIRRIPELMLGSDTGGHAINRWLDNRLVGPSDQPLFLFVNYLECHWPYTSPMRFERRVGRGITAHAEGLQYRFRTGRRTGPWEAVARADQSALQVFSRLYDAALRNADENLAQLIRLLSKAGYLKPGEAIVLVTSDHGEHIGEHGLADHQASVDDHLIRVPFVFWGPERVSPGLRKGLYEFVDVFPALTHALGVDLPLPYLEGRRIGFLDGASGKSRDVAFGEWRSWGEEDLARLSRKNPSFDFSTLCRDLLFVRDDRFKLVREGGVNEGLYDLKKDPMEEGDVASDHPEVVRRLRRELDAMVESWESWGDGSDGLTETEAGEIEEHLSALGYI